MGQHSAFEVCTERPYEVACFLLASGSTVQEQNNVGWPKGILSSCDALNIVCMSLTSTLMQCSGTSCMYAYILYVYTTTTTMLQCTFCIAIYIHILYRVVLALLVQGYGLYSLILYDQDMYRLVDCASQIAEHCKIHDTEEYTYTVHDTENLIFPQTTARVIRK